MSFDKIKTVVYAALNTRSLSPAEQQSLRAVVLTDTNPQRAQFLAEALGLNV